MSKLETMAQSFADMFKATPEKKVVLPSNDVAWSESIMYNGKDFPKYNPDDLIGTKGAGIYRKMMRDEQVKAVTRFKRDAITSRDYMFIVDKDALGEDEADRRVKLSEYILSNMKGSFIDSLNGIMTASYQGFSISEKVFKQLEFEGLTYWGLKALKVKPFDTFKFNADEYGNVIKVTQEMDGKEQTIDIRKFIHYVHNPEYDEHYGQSELYEAYRAYFSKDMVIKFQNIWLEKHAQGYRVLTQSDESTLKSNTAEWNTLVAALTAGGSMILPKGTSLSIDFPSNNVMYKEAIDMYDLHISRSLLVPNLMGITPTGQTGSYSQSDTQLEAFLWTLDADTTRLEEAINEQLFRQLGEINYGDDLWPRFKFKPVSEKKKMEIIKVWKELVAGGAVKATETDATHLRDLLDFPNAAKEEDETGVTSTSPNTALNGAQVTSMVDILTKVTTRELSPDAAIKMLTIAFPINTVTAKQMIDDALKIESSPDADKTKTKIKPKVTIPEGEEIDDADDDVEINGETIQQGAALYSADVISRATKRVDFKVIEHKSIDNEVKYIPVFSKLVAQMGLDVMTKLDNYESVEDIKVKDIKFNASTKSKVQRSVNNMLKDGWKIGERTAANEVDKAKGEVFSASHINKERLVFVTKDYLTDRSFFVAGKLTDDAQALIENVILQGIKYDKTFEQIKIDIIQTFADKNMISIEDAEEALAEALVPNPEIDVSGIKNPTARIETMVRTNTFDAINESRYNFYTDPSLEGFVDGLEYSAILDGRTTSICTEYNGHKAPVDDPIWSTIRPPNHMNCRSLLIPITVLDTWKQSSPLDIGGKDVEPAKGFG